MLGCFIYRKLTGTHIIYVPLRLKGLKVRTVSLETLTHCGLSEYRGLEPKKKLFCKTFNDLLVPNAWCCVPFGLVE